MKIILSVILFIVSLKSQIAIINLSADKSAGLQLRDLLDKNSITYQYFEKESILTNIKSYFLFLGQSPNNISISTSFADSLTSKINNNNKLYIESGDFFYLDSKNSLHNNIDINGIADSRNRIDFIKNDIFSLNYNGSNYYIDEISTDSGKILFNDNNGKAATIGINNQIVASVFESGKLSHSANHPSYYWADVFKYLALNEIDVYENNNLLSTATLLKDTLRYINSKDHKDLFYDYFYLNDTVIVNSSSLSNIKLFNSDSTLLSSSINKNNHQFIFPASAFYYFNINNSDSTNFNLFINKKYSVASTYSPKHLFTTDYIENEILLHFQKPDSIPNGALIDYYIIERSLYDESNFMVIESNYIFSNPLQLIYKDEMVVNGNRYKYRVKTVFKSPSLESAYSYSSPAKAVTNKAQLIIPYTENLNDDSQALTVNIQNSSNFYNYTEENSRPLLLSHDHEFLKVSFFRQEAMGPSDKIIISITDFSSKNYSLNGSIEYFNNTLNYVSKSGNYLNSLTNISSEANPSWLNVEKTSTGGMNKVEFKISLLSGPFQYNYRDSFSIHFFDVNTNNLNIYSNYPSNSQLDYPWSYQGVKLAPKDTFELSGNFNIKLKEKYENLDIFPNADADSFFVNIPANEIIRLDLYASNSIRSILSKDNSILYDHSFSGSDTIYQKITEDGIYKLKFFSTDTVRNYSFSIVNSELSNAILDTFYTELSTSILLPYSKPENIHNLFDSVEFRISSPDTSSFHTDFLKSESLIEINNIPVNKLFIKYRSIYKDNIKSNWSIWKEFILNDSTPIINIPFDTSSIVIDANNSDWKYYKQISNKIRISQDNNFLYLYYEQVTDTQYMIIKQSGGSAFLNDLLIEINPTEVKYFDLNKRFPNVEKTTSAQSFTSTYTSNNFETKIPKLRDSIAIAFFGNFSLPNKASYQSSVYLLNSIAKSNAKANLVEERFNFIEDSLSNFSFNSFDPDNDSVFVYIESKPGWLTIDLVNQQVSGTPGNSNVGTDYIKFLLEDSRRLVSRDSIEINVKNINDSPEITTIPDITINEDDSTVIPLRNYISDKDNSFGELNIATDIQDSIEARNLRFYIQNDSLYLVPKSNYFKDSIRIRLVVSDSSLMSSTNFKLTILPINDIPSFQKDTLFYTLNEEDSVYINKDSIKSIVYDPDENLLNFTFPANSYFSIENQAEYWLIKPGKNLTGVFSQNLIVTDTSNSSDTLNLKFSIQNINDPPVSSFPENLYLLENNDTILDLSLFISDIETEVDSLTFHISLKDTVVDSTDLHWYRQNNSLVITAKNEFNHSALSFGYVLSDKIDSINGTFTLHIIEVNEKPSFTINKLTVQKKEDLLFSLKKDSIHSFIIDPDDSTYTYNFYGFQKTRFTESTNSFHVSNDLNYFGKDSGFLVIYDKVLASDTIEVQVSVEAINDPPSIIFTSDLELFEDSIYLIHKDSLAYDPDNQNLNYNFVHPLDSSLLIVSDSDDFIKFEAKNNYFSSNNTLKFVVSDHHNLKDSTILNFSIKNRNDAPVLKDTLYFSKQEDIDLTISADTLLSQVIDYDDDLNYEFLSSSIYTTVKNGDSVYIRTAVNYYGTDSLRIRFYDSRYSVINLIRIATEPINDLPVININDTIIVHEDDSIKIGLKSTISDIDDLFDSLKFIVKKEGPDSNKLSINIESDSLKIRGKKDQSAFLAKFTLSVTDKENIPVIKTIHIVVTEKNDKPAFTETIHLKMNEDEEISVLFDSLNSIVFDPDDNKFEYIFTKNSNFDIRKTSDAFFLKPKKDYHGTGFLELIVFDSKNASDSILFTYSIKQINDPPKWSLNDTISFTENDSIMLNMKSIVNDVDHNLSELNFSFSTDKNIRIVQIDSILQIKGEKQSFGIFSSGLKASDPMNARDSIEIIIKIDEFNDPPKFINNIKDYTLYEDKDSLIHISKIRSLVDDPDDVFLNTQISDGNLLKVFIKDSFINIIPTLNRYGRDSVKIKVSDKTGLSDSTFLKFNVLAVNDPPLTFFTKIDLREEDSITVNPYSYVFDPDNSYEDLSVTISSYDQQYLSITKSQNLKIRGKQDVSDLTANIFLTISDRHSETTDTLSINIININDPPKFTFSFQDTVDEDSIIKIKLNRDIVIDPDNTVQDLNFYTKTNLLVPDKKNDTLIIKHHVNYSGNINTYLYVSDSLLYDSTLISLKINEINDLPDKKQEVIDSTFSNTKIKLAIDDLFFDPDDTLFDLSVSQNEYGIKVQQIADSIQFQLRALPFKNNFYLYFSDKSKLKDSIKVSYYIDPDLAYGKQDFKLYQNYPNPFNPTTKIPFFIPKETDVEISIFNVLGQKVLQQKSHKYAGLNEFNWDAGNIASGIYFVRVKFLKQIKQVKIVLLK